MRKAAFALGAAVIGCVAGFEIANTTSAIEARPRPGVGFSAIPGVVGGQDMFGPFDVVKGWPKDISTVPGNEKWTWGAGQSIYAESPDRIYLIFRGELPNIKRPATKLLPEFGPSIQFPIGRLPFRDATVSALPGRGRHRSRPRRRDEAVEGHARRRCEMGKLHHRGGSQRQHH